MGAYKELPGHHLRSTLDFMASAPASCRYDPRDRRPHIHPSYYYFGAPDSDFADDSYDPTRECFHIDGAIALDSEAKAAVEGGNATPPHVELPDARDEAQFLGADQGAQLEKIQELQAMLDEERQSLHLLQQTLEREHAAHARGGGARERARDVNRRIIENRAGEPPVFNRAS
jgi:hypothetical protein